MRLAVLACCALSPCVMVAAEADPAAFRKQTETWRQDREARLRAPDGWLAVAGLTWLRAGDNTVGAAEDSDVQLPAGAAPGRLGVLRLDGKAVTFQPAGATALSVNGKRAQAGLLRSDAGGAKPDMVTLGRLTFFVIQRGERVGIRMRDTESEYRRGFRGLSWYEADPAWRVRGTFEPYAALRTVRIETVIGEPEMMRAPGLVRLQAAGREVTLEPVVAEDGRRLWFIFRDETARRDTYQGGRFLYAEPPQDGVVWLDFNQAYNPPCVFTPHATCPLPPPQNRLPIAVTAGERRYVGAVH